MKPNNTENIVQDIVELIDNDLKSISEVAAALDVDRSYASGCLQALSDLGVLEKRKVGPNKLYRVRTLEPLHHGEESLQQLVKQ